MGAGHAHVAGIRSPHRSNQHARHMVPTRSRESRELVTTARFLADDGVTRRQTAAEVGSGRWQRAGLAIVMHNGPLSPAQRRRVARIHAGPRSVLTAFTVAEICGLRGWERAHVDVLAPAGTRLRSGCPVPVRLYLHGIDSAPRVVSGGGVELLPDALLRAAATFRSPRPACGLLAAAVQQQLTTTKSLAEALDRHSRTRHRRALTLAVADIEGGSQALSEIDFVRLCRRYRLPEPVQQRLRREPSGRRRYLDAS
jgi:hypothetical protein